MRLALDPGVKTGVGWREYSDLVRTTPESPRQLVIQNASSALHGVEWPGEMIVVILDGFDKRGLDEIVVENFRSRPGPAVNLSAPEVIGRIYAWADARGIPILRQDAAPVKTRVTKDRLRDAGGWLRGQQHARDALRHLLYREEKLGFIDLENLS